jgi:hypothetical protein
MTMSRRTLVLLVLLTALLYFPTVATAGSDSGCTSTGDLGGVHEACLKSGTETNDYVAGHSDHTYSIRAACGIGGSTLCDKPAVCSVDGHDGFLYNVYEDASTEPLDWQACLTNQEAKRLGALTPAVIESAFRRLAWPASPLVVQPPKGKTLVNFDTNFYTTNDHPTTQTVTLIGQRVTIEATPTVYTWHFGPGSGDRTTTTPGAAYPDLQVTYRYLEVGTVHPGVDTTYAGRYRVGNGAWRQIPDTLTVPGTTVDLRVVSATPHLVGD